MRLVPEPREKVQEDPMTEKIIAPTIHLNGTSGRDLHHQVSEALHAARAAAAALSPSAPNARDYYVQDPEAFAIAQEQFRLRMADLGRITHELTEILDAIETQCEERGIEI
jgi:hypothetical protein